MTDTAYIFGMTSLQEQAFLRHYAREVYTGSGALVDLGCWLGSSTIALAQGLAERSFNSVVHSYDRFIWEEWMEIMNAGMQRAYESGESFLPEFRERTAPWEHLIEIHVADLSQTTWQNEPIEFLFVDAMKSWELTRAIATGFFPSLEPGSVVMHQDFVLSGCPWIHVLMFRAREYFEPIRHVEPWSFVFRTVTTPTIEAMCVAADSAASLGEIDDAFGWSESLLNERWRLPIIAAKVELLCLRGDHELARREAARWFVGLALEDPEVKSVLDRHPELA